MFTSPTVFEENNLSNTVVEFKISANNATLYSLHPLNISAVCFVVLFALWTFYHGLSGLQIVSILLCLVLLVFMKYIVVEESIIIIKNFGIQLRIRYLLGAENTQFLDTDRIEGIFIHEYFYGSEVHYSLAFIVAGQERLSLLFKHLYPGFSTLKRVYNSCQQNL
mmetsp:Transcript_15323/g.25586  ORF Transcript_15323/g.25586 Transcript_15323/m.25586 type:complete len:165 (+) Transcript_15323:96-590(+)